MKEYKFLISPWKSEFIDLIRHTQRSLFISSPFINMGGVGTLTDAVVKKDLKLTLLTSLTVRNIQHNVTDPQALLNLYGIFSNVSLSSLGRLHAKTYIVDENLAVITSANLTDGGLESNFEYGVIIKNKKVVKEIKIDLGKYFELGNIFSLETLRQITKEVNGLIKVQDRFRAEIQNTKLKQLLNKKVEDLDYELLKNRVKGGRTINSIFAETILYLLEKKGALSTGELNPLIQAIHPEICDDSIDRVINGQHFGKKWKHLVRDAQQFLKKKEKIYLKRKKWHLIP